MKSAQVGRDSSLAQHTFFLRGTAENVSELTKTFGLWLRRLAILPVSSQAPSWDRSHGTSA
jgi:hypothetical protein